MLGKIYFPLFALALTSLSGCGDDPRPAIHINEVLVKGMGSFQFQEGMILVGASTERHEIFFKTTPRFNNIFYATGNSDFQLQRDWIDVDSSIAAVRFFAKTPYYKKTSKSKTATLRFDFKSKDYLDSISWSPAQSADTFHYELENPARGRIKVWLFDVYGYILWKLDRVKRKDGFIIEEPFPELKNGIYTLKITFGESTAYRRYVIDNSEATNPDAG